MWFERIDSLQHGVRGVGGVNYFSRCSEPSAWALPSSHRGRPTRRLPPPQGLTPRPQGTGCPAREGGGRGRGPRAAPSPRVSQRHFPGTASQLPAETLQAEVLGGRRGSLLPRSQPSSGSMTQGSRGPLCTLHFPPLRHGRQCVGCSQQGAQVRGAPLTASMSHARRQSQREPTGNLRSSRGLRTPLHR